MRGSQKLFQSNYDLDGMPYNNDSLGDYKDIVRRNVVNGLLAVCGGGNYGIWRLSLAMVS